MTDRTTRRSLLAAASTGVAGLAGCLRLSGGNPTTAPPTRSRTATDSPTPTDTPTATATDSPTDTPTPTDSPTPTESPTATPRPGFSDDFERGTAAWALEPVASQGATVTLADTGGYEDSRALRWEFTEPETTAYAVTVDPVIAPGQTVTALARLPNVAERSPSLSLAGPGVFGTEGPGGLLQFGYEGWGDGLFVEANSETTLGRADGGGVVPDDGWVEFRIDWSTTDRPRFSLRNLATDTRTPTLTRSERKPTRSRVGVSDTTARQSTTDGRLHP